MGSQNIDVARGMRCRRGCIGNFKAPIAGLVFTLEVLMIDLTMASLLPLLITSVTASIAFIRADGYGVDVLFPLRLSVCDGARSLCHRAGCFLRIGGLVFHLFYELDRKYFPPLL